VPNDINLEEITQPSAFGAQVKADLAAFERYRVEESPLDDIHSKPTSPGVRSYVSSLYGPMSYGNASPSIKNRILASPP
jgi:hypothetical protein